MTKKFFYNIVTSNIFNNLILAMIIANTLIMSLEGNYFDPETWFKIDSTNLFFNAVYIVEFVMKIIGLGVGLYFSDFNNVLDFVIVCLCVIDFSVYGKEEYDQITEFTYLRLFRVLRVFKILSKITVYKKIMTGMMKDIIKVFFLVLLFIIFLIIFILFGMSFLSASYNYNTFVNAFFTEFQVFSMQNWNEILYDAYS